MVAAVQCYLGEAWYALDPSLPKFFGFSEFIAGLALLVLAWTTADFRYRFRVFTAPIPLRKLTFGAVVAIGLLTLLTDLWRAQQWCVPEGGLVSPGGWQAILGLGFLLTFLTWAWFAFFAPARISRLNIQKFAEAMGMVTLKGDPQELALLVDELRASSERLVAWAIAQDATEEAEKDKLAEYANTLWSMLSDRRVCRAMVTSSPGTLIAIFDEFRRQRRYPAQAKLFLRNLFLEALCCKSSFIYTEQHGVDSGLIGFQKPVSTAVFAHYRLVGQLSGVFPTGSRWEDEWDAKIWDGYFRMLLIAVKAASRGGYWEICDLLQLAVRNADYVTHGLSKLNGVEEDVWRLDAPRRTASLVKFVNDVVSTVGLRGQEELLSALRYQREVEHYWASPIDSLAKLGFELIHSVSYVNHPHWTSFNLQHNTVWTDLQMGAISGTSACWVRRALMRRIRRLIFNEIKNMERVPNFKGARLIGFCLNVMGIGHTTKQVMMREEWPLRVAVLAWVRRHFARLHAEYPRIAEVCLVDSFAYEPEKLRIVKSYRDSAYMRGVQVDYLDVEPIPKASEIVAGNAEKGAHK